MPHHGCMHLKAVLCSAIEAKMLIPQAPFPPKPSPRSLGASKDIRGASWPTDESKGERHGDRMEEQ